MVDRFTCSLFEFDLIPLGRLSFLLSALKLPGLILSGVPRDVLLLLNRGTFFFFFFFFCNRPSIYTHFYLEFSKRYLSNKIYYFYINMYTLLLQCDLEFNEIYFINSSIDLSAHWI